MYYEIAMINDDDQAHWFTLKQSRKLININKHVKQTKHQKLKLKQTDILYKPFKVSSAIHQSTSYINLQSCKQLVATPNHVCKRKSELCVQQVASPNPISATTPLTTNPCPRSSRSVSGMWLTFRFIDKFRNIWILSVILSLFYFLPSRWRPMGSHSRPPLFWLFV